MVGGDAGKGDTYRPVNKDKYDVNYEAIFNPPVCEKCRKPMKQYRIGKRIFYCSNERCERFEKNVEF